MGDEISMMTFLVAEANTLLGLYDLEPEHQPNYLRNRAEWIQESRELDAVDRERMAVIHCDIDWLENRINSQSH